MAKAFYLGVGLKRKLLSGLMLTLSMLCILISGYKIKPAGSTWTGTVYIRADGSIDPPDAPITTLDNITYTLTDNITSSGDGIVVERDNIVIDGAGYTLEGTGAYPYKGICLDGRSNVTIKNTIITTFYYGILLYSSSNNSISGNNIANNGFGISLGYSSNNSIFGNNITTNNYDGIELYYSSNNSICENNITANNENGIDLYYSSNNSISGNTFIKDGLFVWFSYHNSVENNTVNGKPLVYLEGVVDQRVEDAGQVILVNCNGIRVENLNLSSTDVGVQLWETTNNVISGNNIANNFNGILLYSSSNYNSIVGNNIANNGRGLHLHSSSSNIIIGNNITANNGSGIELNESSNNRIAGNILTNNYYGVMLDYSTSYNNIIGNNILSNNFGIYLNYYPDSYTNYYNEIYHNNFIDNYYYQACCAIQLTSINIWDDGYPSGGNYWSDYEERYLDAKELDGSGLWDTPYVIDENNVDHYPLMYPYGTLTYKLTITTSTGGTTDPKPGIHTYANGTEVSATAIPDIGYSFDYWILDGELKTENPITITMDSNYTLQAYFIDDIKPDISDPWQDPPPNNVQPYQNVTVWVNVTEYGSGIKNATLWYSLDNGTSWETPINMTALPIPSDTAITYEATIPGYKNCTWITYKIVAYDKAGNNQTKDNNGYYYKYHVIPEFPLSVALLGFLVLIIIPLVFIKKKHNWKPIS